MKFMNLQTVTEENQTTTRWSDPVLLAWALLPLKLMWKFVFVCSFRFYPKGPYLHFLHRKAPGVCLTKEFKDLANKRWVCIYIHILVKFSFEWGEYSVYSDLPPVKHAASYKCSHCDIMNNLIFTRLERLYVYCWAFIDNVLTIQSQS